MSFLFPHKEDITLKAPPLFEVICQIRFAPILRIAGSLPIDYQDRIRQRFPSLVKRELGVSPISPQPGEFIFETANGLSNTSLAINFIAVVTHKYLHWQSFSSDLKLVFNSFEQVYGTILATRVGLRYVNQLQCSNTGTDSLDDLLDFLNPELTQLYKNFHATMWHPIMMKIEVRSCAFRHSNLLNTLSLKGLLRALFSW